MKKLSLFLFLPLLLSCSQEHLGDMGYEMAQTSYEVLEVDSVRVNADEVRNVVESVFPQTKSSNGGYTVETIYGDSQNPLVYVVNKPNNGGFMIISATKNYDPVLAYNTTGHFSVGGEKPDGLKMWQEGTLKAVEASDTFRQDVKQNYRRLWRQYEEETKANAKISRSSDILTLEEAQELNKLRQVVEKKKGELHYQGHRIYSVDDRITGDEAFDESMREYIKEAIHPEYADYWNVLSFISYDPRPKAQEHIANFVQSEWHQTGIFNIAFPVVDSFHPLAGCMPVAIGQVMRYYEYPHNYNWSSMPANGSKETSQFLYEVATRCKATYRPDGTAVTLPNALNCLYSYGYSADLGAYDKVNESASLRRKEPVIMTGFSDNGNGHAWVASGLDYVYRAPDRYEVWTYIRRTEFGNMYSFTKGYGYSRRLYYMNWGYPVNPDTFETCNGYFNVNSFRIPFYGDSFTNRLQYVVNIKPVNF